MYEIYESPRKYVSEQMNPFAAYMIGVGGMRVMDYVENYKKNPKEHLAWSQLANEMVSYWYLINNGLNTIGAACAGKGPVNFSVAISNETRKTAEFLKKLGGVCPLFEEERFNNRQFNFDHLVK